jgi:xanthine/CO dehydrogenase XdhC/CoxF family maturation factor
VSIFAEIIALRTARPGRRLADTSGSIHPRELHTD